MSVRVGSDTRGIGGWGASHAARDTSPHELACRERDRLCGLYVSDEELLAGELEELDRVRRFDPRYDRWGGA